MSIDYSDAVLVDANIVFYLNNYEYQNKEWKDSIYFERFLSKVENSSLVLIENVCKEISPPFDKPSIVKPHINYLHKTPSLKNIWNKNKEQVYSMLFKYKKDCDILIKSTKLASRLRHIKKVKKQEDLKNVNELLASPINNIQSKYESLKEIDLYKIIWKATSTIKDINQINTTTDLYLIFYCLLGNFKLATMDNALAKVFIDSGLEDRIIRIHFLYNQYLNRGVTKYN